jgi:3-phenylpropionate/trans-cinnamate dioxygenase ferredoxin reductase subunit
MGAQDRRFVIVGGGLAGAKAAETLREEGFDGAITIVGEEPQRPYERPPLSKEYLRGEAEGKPYVHPEEFYAENQIELRTATVATEIDLEASEVAFGDAARLRYDRLLLATGAEPRRIDVSGGDLDGIFHLRTLADSEAIAAAIERVERLVVVGSGWIGAEIAASARSKGVEVTMVEMASLPLERVLGPTLGQFYLDVHRDHGTEFLPETTVERFEGEGSVERVLTRDGAVVEAQAVVVGVGVTPRTALAEAAGIRTENGVLVDERLETSAPGVFAAGDIANAANPFYGRRLRVEHWANALGQGPAAARSMLGGETGYDEIPYFFSDQYDIGMEYSGVASTDDEVVIRGDLAAREFIAFWLADDRVVAGMNVNVWDVSDPIRDLIRSREPVDVGRLADPGVPLEDLAVKSGSRA